MLKKPGTGKTAVRAVSLALFCLTLFNCVPKKTVKVAPYPVTSSYLMDKIAFDHIDTLSGTSSIRIYNEEEYVAYLTGVMHYRKPDLLAISVFGPFGVTVMKMLIADAGLEIYVPKKDTLYTAPLNVPFLLPDSDILQDYDVSLTETDSDYILGLYSSYGADLTLSSRYYFEKDTANNYKIEKYNTNRRIFTILIEDTTEDNIPSAFSVIAGKSRFEIKTNNMAVNSELPSQAFTHMSAPTIRPAQEFLRALEPYR